MKKYLLFLFTFLFTTPCYNMETPYIFSEEEMQLEQMFNNISDTLDTWLDNFSIEQIDNAFLKFPKKGRKIVQTRIKFFAKKPVQRKQLSLKKYNFTELKNALKKNNIKDRFIRDILHTVMLEGTAYYNAMREEKENEAYFSMFMEALDQIKEELRKPL